MSKFPGYVPCAVCERPTLDVDGVEYEPDPLESSTIKPKGVGDMRVLCDKCARTHYVTTVLRDPDAITPSWH